MAGTGKSSGAAKRSASGKVTTTHTTAGKKRTNTATKKKTAVNRRNTRAKAGGRAKSRQKSVEEINAYQDHLAFETGITIFVISIISIFLYLSYFGLAGKTGTVIGGLMFGVFGWFAWLLPLFCMIGFVFCIVNQGDRRVTRRVGSFVGIILSLLGLSDLVFQKQIITEYYTSNHVLHKDYLECMFLTCQDVVGHGRFNGGLCGRAVSSVFSMVIGGIGAGIILFVLLLFCLYIFYGVELMSMLRKRNAYHQEMKEVYEEISQEEDYKEPSYRVFTNARPDRASRAQSESNLEKVPKVQSFDLRKMEDAPHKKAAKPVEKAVEEKGRAAANALDTKKKQTASQEEDSKKIRPTGYQEVEEVCKAKKAAEKEAIATQESTVAQIPIYRNELNEKFGGKKKKQSIEKATEEKKIETTFKENERTGVLLPEEEKYFTKEAAQKSAFEEFQDELQNGQADKELEKEPVVSAEHVKTTSQDIDIVRNKKAPDTDNVKDITESAADAQKPSVPVLEDVEKVQGWSALVEEDTEDVQNYSTEIERTEESQEKVSDSSKKAESQEPEPQEPVRPKKPLLSFGQSDMQKSNGHGKIGGDNYVSASDTFNALNESKVSVEEGKPYEIPPIDLLALPKEAQNQMSDEQLRMTASKLQDTLKSFNVNVNMGPVTCGPTVTRYELFPEQGVRVNKITNLADDLKLSLAAASIRIEAPIPGKAAVGIEVPNATPSSVYFRELLEGDAFANAKSDLTFAVGKDIAGKLIMADIAKMPHLLIAGATGSGKSVCINTLIMSILYKADPKDVKLIMIDPKVVELSVYNGIPHLFCPVVTDPKEAAAALNWAVREMMDRYNKFKELGVRNISGYNAKIKEFGEAESAGYTKMPYLIVIVDEFADLMMVASKEVEDAVCRLAQLARAAGIHLVLATQRPSVNVITGVIKANIPSRIAFSVSSVIDSRTILDKGGAEKLLGKGDMLFFPSGYSEPVRVQGAFVSDKEVSDVVDFLRSNNETPEYDHSVTEIIEEPKETPASEEKKSQADRDEYFEDAGRFVIESDRAAAGQLQRRFSIGFNRAGRIIDQLNKAGVVGPAEGTKPRKVLMTMEEFERMLSGDEGAVSQEEMESMVKEMEEETVATQEI